MNEVPLNILTFPIWWYTDGAGLIWRISKRKLALAIRTSGLGIFARHLTEPIYGDYTRTGRIVSFFLRIVLLVAKFIFLLIRFAVIIFFYVCYLAILPVSLIMIVYQFFPL